jgi:hypothetical protein
MDDWYWHFLGLQPGASRHDIEHAHRRLAKLLHPDHGGTNEDMVRLNEAYELAKDAAPPAGEPATEKPPQTTESPSKARSHAHKPRDFLQNRHTRHWRQFEEQRPWATQGTPR